MPPEVEEQPQAEQDFFADTEEVTETVEQEEPALETAVEPAPSPSDDLIRQNQELQRRVVDLIDAQRPKQEPAKGPDLREILAKRFDEKTAANLAESLQEFEQILASKYAQKEELNRFSGTLAHLARNSDEARVFEEFRQQGIPDADIKETRKLVDQMVQSEGAYFPNAQVAMDAAYGRLRRQRAKKTAGATTAARTAKTAGREAADMGAGRGGAGVPVLTEQEKQAAYSMPGDEFLDWYDKRFGK